MKRIINILILLASIFTISAQQDSLPSKFQFQGDFRFRVEEDWNSRKSDGTFRKDRTRLRYRLRSGFEYHPNLWASVGAGLRTGDPNKQQDPQLTLGDGFKEFGTLPFALEKAYFKIQKNEFTIWLGKNTFPFDKNNELFWSDNVFPEGIFIGKTLKLQSKIVSSLNIRGGHFIINARGTNLANDSYVQGLQLMGIFFNQRFKLFPSLYIFRNIQNIPDGNETFFLDYSILNMSANLKPIKKSSLIFEFDYLHNFENYDNDQEILSQFKNQKNGFVFGFGYGNLNKKKDWLFHFTYTSLQQYAVVDFLAQNDWARWDYSSYGSPDGRLSNYKGIEIVLGYKIAQNMVLKTKYYKVKQLVPYGSSLENGDRIRFDIDIKF